MLGAIQIICDIGGTECHTNSDFEAFRSKKPFLSATLWSKDIDLLSSSFHTYNPTLSFKTVFLKIKYHMATQKVGFRNLKKCHILFEWPFTMI